MSTMDGGGIEIVSKIEYKAPSSTVALKIAASLALLFHCAFVGLFAFLGLTSLLIYNLFAAVAFSFGLALMMVSTRPTTKWKSTSIEYLFEFLLAFAVVDLISHAVFATMICGWAWGFQAYIVAPMPVWIQVRVRFSKRLEDRPFRHFLFWSGLGYSIAAIVHSILFALAPTEEMGYTLFPKIVSSLNYNLVAIGGVLLMVRTEFGLTKELIRSKKRIRLVNSLFKRLQAKIFSTAATQASFSGGAHNYQSASSPVRAAELSSIQIEQYALGDPVSFILEGVQKRLGRINYEKTEVDIEGF